MMETTFAIIKPDAVKAHFAGKIIDRIEQEEIQARPLHRALP